MKHEQVHVYCIWFISKAEAWRKLPRMEVIADGRFLADHNCLEGKPQKVAKKTPVTSFGQFEMQLIVSLALTLVMDTFVLIHFWINRKTAIVANRGLWSCLLFTI
jgi:hypothetical protein